MPKSGCIRCLLRDLSEKDKENVEKYISVIKEEDRSSEDEYKRRLDICLMCDKLEEGTCLACGCYVEFRAAGKRAACPKKKW
ncbi:MAG: DUF6171 family protein [Lachnospiraceae bacterium]|nr:DUF6171 family protein [Lachnospiraceae bacterium]